VTEAGTAVVPEVASRRRGRWTGLSSGERMAVRRQFLLDAGFDLLGTKGWAATTVRAVIERAGLNPRYFYESFADLDELVVAVYERVVDDLAAVVLTALTEAGPDPDEQVRAVVRATIDFVDGDRRRGRVLYVEGLGNEALNVRRLQTGQAVVAFVEQYAADHRPAAPEDQIGRVGAAVLVGGFSQLLVDWLAGRIQTDKETLAADAAELFLAIGDAAVSVATRRAPPTGGRVQTSRRPRRTRALKSQR
jgi:AcrR family transcriptional regulator